MRDAACPLAVPTTSGIQSITNDTARGKNRRSVFDASLDKTASVKRLTLDFQKEN